MGEIAEMMLNGDLCEGCGIYLPGDGEGFPRYCHDCTVEQSPKEKCHICGKRKKNVKAHIAAVHPEEATS